MAAAEAYERWCFEQDEQRYGEQQYPSPEDQCAPDHAPAGADAFGDRCYCGKVRWLREVA
jgi:hypothetical protein